jgi:hypothetical protein
MTYTTWLASLSTSDRATWDAMLDNDSCSIDNMADWAEGHNGQRWYAELATDGTLDVRATEYQRWEELGLEAIQMWHEMEFCNQEPDGFDQSRGEWYIADDSHQAIISGTYGNDHSPGCSHYTYATIYRDASEYRAALAEWEDKPEWLESDDDYEEEDELDDLYGDGSADDEQEDSSIPF